MIESIKYWGVAVASQKEEVEKISNILIEFFKTKRLKDSLTAFTDTGISGWEKWWQMELALYLSTHEQIAEWDMEHRFEVDHNAKLAQSKIALDVGFRLRNHRKDNWYFLELKQDNDYKKCINRMCTDAIKVFSAKNKSTTDVSIRYIACAGIFLADAENHIFEFASSKLDEYEIDFHQMTLVPIGKHHQMLVF